MMKMITRAINTVEDQPEIGLKVKKGTSRIVAVKILHIVINHNDANYDKEKHVIEPIMSSLISLLLVTFTSWPLIFGVYFTDPKDSEKIITTINRKRKNHQQVDIDPLQSCP